MQLARVVCLENARGRIGTYVHHDNKTGALISLATDALPDRADEETPETNPAHREMIRKYKEEYAAYVQAREELANRSKGEFFSIEWIGNEAAEGKQRGGSSEKSPKYKTPAKPKRGSAKGRARKGARRRK